MLQLRTGASHGSADRLGAKTGRFSTGRSEGWSPNRPSPDPITARSRSGLPLTPTRSPPQEAPDGNHASADQDGWDR